MDDKEFHLLRKHYKARKWTKNYLKTLKPLKSQAKASKMSSRRLLRALNEPF